MSILNIIKKLFGRGETEPVQSSKPIQPEPAQTSKVASKKVESEKTVNNTESVKPEHNSSASASKSTEHQKTHHAIIGAGPCGVIAAETLRKANPTAEITLIGDEAEPPYSRMAIPYLLINNIGEEGTYLRQPTHYQEQNINYLSQPVTSINPDKSELSLADGSTLSYEKLLIAAGSYPVSPPIDGIDLPNVHSCWTLKDARQIASLAKEESNVVLMGAGFIGCIILEALVKRGVNLSVIEMEDRMVPRMLDEKAGGLLKKWCIEKGVNVLTSTKITAIEESGQAMVIETDNGESLSADLVISATGVRANTAFLQGSGIEVDHGIVVNNKLQTNIANIYAAGDVAQGKDFSTGDYEVQAIQPTATDHGRIAALNMAGQSVEHHGSVNMNVLDTLGLISHSFGLWMGVEGGDSVEIYNPDAYKYMNLRFGVGDEEDVLVGVSTLGVTQHIGVIRGLIESKIHLKEWKERLMQDPTRIMEAYLSSTQELDNVI
ncbi:MAG: NAD(P)/FAD-dependent oxidoreductase [Cocleimonas sp.]|nr:NAD(P)/FAD-dependent oxidoreductase [Cocleimonas sp.]